MSCRSAFDPTKQGVFDDFASPLTTIRNPSLYPAELRVLSIDVNQYAV